MRKTSSAMRLDFGEDARSTRGWNLGKPMGLFENIDDIQKLVQLVLGLLAAIALIYFIYIETLNPDLVITDRSFWVLVVLAASALGLTELLEFVGMRGGGGGDNDG
jgi:hypothetical protein